MHIHAITMAYHLVFSELLNIV